MSLARGSLDPLRAAASLQPRLGRKIRTGIRIYRRDEALGTIRKAAERGFAIATHAIGNEAIDLALDAYEAVGPSVGSAGRPRIEHATFLDRARIRRIADLGVTVVVQPHFVTLPAMGDAPAIPGLANSPLRWLLDAGVRVAGSSDYPVASFAPLDGIRSAVARRTSRGRVLGPDQRLSAEEALALYTRGAAEACGILDEAGTLEPGKRADLVVLDGPLASLDGRAVKATVIGGEVVFGAL
jgi:predicted amidohydrolase YtcJ